MQFGESPEIIEAARIKRIRESDFAKTIIGSMRLFGPQ
jgi:hypothetical protein